MSFRFDVLLKELHSVEFLALSLILFFYYACMPVFLFVCSSFGHPSTHLHAAAWSQHEKIIRFLHRDFSGICFRIIF